MLAMINAAKLSKFFFLNIFLSVNFSWEFQQTKYIFIECIHTACFAWNNCHLGNGSLRAGEMYKRLTFKLKPEPFITTVETEKHYYKITQLWNYETSVIAHETYLELCSSYSFCLSLVSQLVTSSFNSTNFTECWIWLFKHRGTCITVIFKPLP